MSYLDVRKDMTAAEAILKKTKLDEAVRGFRLLCEVYCRASFHWQTFYLRVYDGLQYTILYVKPHMADYYGYSTVSATFCCTLEADMHPGCRGDTFCGIKHFPKDHPVINSLVHSLPGKDEIQEQSRYTLDGNVTVVMNRTIDPVAVRYFENEDFFAQYRYSDQEKEFLCTLHEKIEELIGNLRKTNRM